MANASGEEGLAPRPLDLRSESWKMSSFKGRLEDCLQVQRNVLTFSFSSVLFSEKLSTLFRILHAIELEGVHRGAECHAVSESESPDGTYPCLRA